MDYSQIVQDFVRIPLSARQQRYLQKDGVGTPVIVVTAYEAFSEGACIVSLDDLRQQLLIEFPENFQGLVYYNVLYRDWMDALEILSKAILRDE